MTEKELNILNAHLSLSEWRTVAFVARARRYVSYDEIHHGTGHKRAAARFCAIDKKYREGKYPKRLRPIIAQIVYRDKKNRTAKNRYGELSTFLTVRIK